MYTSEKGRDKSVHKCTFYANSMGVEATLKIAIVEERAKYTSKGDEKEWPIG